ncbi:hypothetical protein QMG83_06730 [Salinibacterium sp. G-O1]|uniref:hypothetical protein n=1 Tax=Salinibacterium sp. G-O1 TaxID=3046208 RepID=UPI0024B915AE|nr:hypothetical protein [Salinibacterium sp. G-O1]MDJ0334914.1 hypothetical protein [Salinibacterium sp. G-O1]
MNVTHITLERLHSFDSSKVAKGEYSLAVARQEAATWPSQEVLDFAAERSRLLHRLAEEDGVEVRAWGEVDGEIPREVAEIVLGLAPAVVAAAATIIASWIARLGFDKRRKGDSPETVAGVKLTDSRGRTLELGIRDGFTREQRADLIRDFLDRDLAPA